MGGRPPDQRPHPAIGIPPRHRTSDREAGHRGTPGAPAGGAGLREERTRQADVDAELQRARERTEQARQRMSAIEEQLHQAREEYQRAENEQQKADEHSRSATNALAQAERAAHETAQHVRRMTAGTT